MTFQNSTAVFTGLSDFHKLVLTVLKSKPQQTSYRDHEKFDSVRFNDELKYVLAKEKFTSHTKFDEMFLRILNKHASIKSKLLRANHASYISKTLRKAIMKRSYLENLYFKKRASHSLRNYKKQKIYCSRLYKKERKNFFNKLNTSFVSDNKLFWKTVKLFFSNKGSQRGNIKLVEGDKLLHDDSEVAEELNNFFKEAVSILDVNENSYIINCDSINISDPIEKAMSKYKFHPSILLIKGKVTNQDKFSFNPISKLEIQSEVQLINPKKATTSDRIPPKILKIISEVSADTFESLFNDILKLEIFLKI